MAGYAGTVINAYHGTLQGGTIDTVHFSATPYTVSIYNIGAGTIYYKTNLEGTAAVVSKGDDSRMIAPSERRTQPYPSAVTYVQLISAGTPEYEVESY